MSAWLLPIMNVREWGAPGRPRVLRGALLEEAKRLEDAGVPRTDIARRLHIDRATILRHFGPKVTDA